MFGNTSGVVRRAVKEPVGGAVNEAVGGAANWAVGGTVYWAVYWAVEAVDTAVEEDSLHLGLQDFLLDVGLTPDG